MNQAQKIMLSRGIVASLGMVSGIAFGCSFYFSEQAASLNGHGLGEWRWTIVLIITMIWGSATAAYGLIMHWASLHANAQSLAPLIIPFVIFHLQGRMIFRITTIGDEAFAQICAGLLFLLLICNVYLIQRHKTTKQA